MAITEVPVKQAVIAPSALRLIYPQEPMDGYSREQFIDDLVNEAEADVRRCLQGGAHGERERIGIHACPGGDRDATPQPRRPLPRAAAKPAAAEGGELLHPTRKRAGSGSVLQAIRKHAQPDQCDFLGVIDPIDSRVEAAAEVRDRVLRAAEHIPVERLGSTDDCGFAPFRMTPRRYASPAFAKIRARVEGTRMASEQLGV